MHMVVVSLCLQGTEDLGKYETFVRASLVTLIK